VLDTLAAAGLVEVIVVEGANGDDVEAAIRWRDERRVRNPAPQRGLASSLIVGLVSLSLDVDAAVVTLGDQPRLRADVVHAVIDAWRASDRPIAIARYAHDGALNPVVLGRDVFETAMRLEGDRGMGPLIHRSPDLVTEVAVPGDNPDVDTPADLARLTSRAGGEERSKGSGGERA
jgi:molybdenum cofactor cytidylyltransferase